MEKLVFVLCTVLAIPVARAAPVDATITASSKAKQHPPWHAFDRDELTVWCEGKKGAGTNESLTITFAAPVQVERLGIRAGHRGRGGRDRPRAITVVSDSGTVELALEEDDDGNGGTWGSLDEDQLPARTTSLTFRFTALDRGKTREACIGEIDLGLVGASFVLGVAGADFAALDARVQAMGAAMQSCDVAKIAKLVKLPVEVMEANNDGVDQIGYAGGPVRLRKKKQLKRLCWPDMPKGPPTIQQGIGPSLVRVEWPVSDARDAEWGPLWLDWRWDGKTWRMTRLVTPWVDAA